MCILLNSSQEESITKIEQTKNHLWFNQHGTQRDRDRIAKMTTEWRDGPRKQQQQLSANNSPLAAPLLSPIRTGPAQTVQIEFASSWHFETEAMTSPQHGELNQPDCLLRRGKPAKDKAKSTLLTAKKVNYQNLKFVNEAKMMKELRQRDIVDRA